MAQRINKFMRDAIRGAVIDHAFKERIATLDDEVLNLRREAIALKFDAKEIAAIKLLTTTFPDVFRRGIMSVNCGGPTVDLQFMCGRQGDHRPFPDTELSLPSSGWGTRTRLDLAAEDAFACTVMAVAEMQQELGKERGTMNSQVYETLKGFKTVEQLRSAWPDVMTVAQPVIDEHTKVVHATTLPAVQFDALNAALRLPANDELELTEAVA